MKILVTGGAGFIGSHLVDALIKKKHRVFVIDNLSTGFRKNINPKAKFYKADLTNFPAIEKIAKKEKPDVIFHLAAQIDLRKSVADPLFEAKNNVLASINLIDIACRLKVKKFIFSSTGGALYGDTKYRPTPEIVEPWPVSPYGIGKLSIEKFLFYSSQVHGFKFVSLRYPNVYGPRQNPYGEVNVVAIFLHKMLQGKQPVINGNGKQTRDYIFIDDITSANLLSLKHFNRIGIYNTSTAKEISVNNVFRELNTHFQNKFKEFHGPAKIGEQKTSCLSYAKIKKDFGWQPKVNFREGIKKTYGWFKKNHAWENQEFVKCIENAKKIIIKSFKSKGKLMTCGNGGSATQASHMVGEFVGRFAFDRPPLPAISLFDLATTTAVGNDYEYDDIFSRFVDSLGNENDILFSISTSGNSGNCLKAMESAKKKGAKNIALLGKDGGKMKNLADVAIIIPADDIPLVQETHLMVIHWLCEEVEKYFFRK